jgi:hypothetical protein
MNLYDFIDLLIRKTVDREPLSDDERVIDDLNSLDYELTQGGLGTYLHNSASARMTEQIAAFRQIGADQCAEALEKLAARLADLIAENPEADHFDVYIENEELFADLDEELSRLVIEREEPWDERLQIFYERRFPASGQNSTTHSRQGR